MVLERLLISTEVTWPFETASRNWVYVNLVAVVVGMKRGPTISAAATAISAHTAHRGID